MKITLQTFGIKQKKTITRAPTTAASAPPAAAVPIDIVELVPRAPSPTPRPLALPSQALVPALQGHSALAYANEGGLPLIAREPTPWQALVLGAACAPDSAFNTSVRATFAGLDQPMRSAFFFEGSPRAWSMLPSARALAETYLADRHGPLTELAPHERFAAMGDQPQFRVAVPAQRNKAMAKLAQIWGHDLYFHGSKTENWHQIISQGLESKSGTGMEINGSAFGQGTYVALESKLSRNFVSLEPGAMAVMGLVEVVHQPLVYKHGCALVVPDNRLLQLRYLAIYPSAAQIPHIHHEALVAGADRFGG